MDNDNSDNNSSFGVSRSDRKVKVMETPFGLLCSELPGETRVQINKIELVRYPAISYWAKLQGLGWVQLQDLILD